MLIYNIINIITDNTYVNLYYNYYLLLIVNMLIYNMITDNTYVNLYYN